MIINDLKISTFFRKVLTNIDQEIILTYIVEKINVIDIDWKIKTLININQK